MGIVVHSCSPITNWIERSGNNNKSHKLRVKQYQLDIKILQVCTEAASNNDLSLDSFLFVFYHIKRLKNEKDDCHNFPDTPRWPAAQKPNIFNSQCYDKRKEANSHI